MPNGVSRLSIKMIFQFTSSNLMYPGNPQFNRLYHLAHIRFNVPENLRIKVKTEQQIADLLHS